MTLAWLVLDQTWNSLIAKASDTEVGLLWQEENTSLSVDRTLEQTTPRGPQLTDDSGDGRFTHTAEQSVECKPEESTWDR